MKVNEYRKIRTDFLESEKIRKATLGRVGIIPIEKALDVYIRSSAERGYVLFELGCMLDRVHGDVSMYVRFNTGNEAREHIIAVAKNFCEREGLQFDEVNLIINWGE